MIAILGATGYIGGALARHLAARSAPLSLFARDPRKLAAAGWPTAVACRDLADFSARDFDLVVNAVGAGDPARVRELGAAILDVSDTWDRRVLDTMAPHTRYVFLSSGAIYGVCTAAPGADAVLTLPVNRLDAVPPYTLAKLFAEARHRHLAERSILDLRVFSFADAGIDLRGTFFLAQLARSVRDGVPFEAAPGDFRRDFCGADELWSMVEHWRKGGAPNSLLDLYSSMPCSKREILDAAEARYGLTVQTRILAEPPTGAKPVYASAFHAAEAFGYRPGRTSLEIVLATLDAIAGREAAPVRLAAGARR